MIKVRGVQKAFDSFVALDNINITVGRGTVYGLVGPNGAGKSTIIRHLTGIYKQDSGEILIDGQTVFENAPLKARIASIPDDLYFFAQASTKDMMRFYRNIYSRFDMSRYERLKDVFSIDERRPIKRLSKGMQKQSAFWLSICMRPDVLILDEPVDGLDPVMRRQVWSLLMGDVAEYGTTVLVSSHNLRELEDVCDHVGVMNKGKMLLERSLSDLQENIVKIQVALPDGAMLPAGLDIINSSSAGRLTTIIVRGTSRDVAASVATANPVFFDLLPLSLEEIFVYELGGADYAVKDIIL